MDILEKAFGKDHGTGLLPGNMLSLESPVEERHNMTGETNILSNTHLLHFSRKKPWLPTSFQSPELNEIYGDWAQKVTPYCRNGGTLS